jgi:hypothetical protein
MKLRALRYTLLLTALFGISFFLRASLPSPVTQLVSGSWVSGCTGATSTSPCKAQFNGNIQDITNPLAPFSVAGNNSLQFKI